MMEEALENARLPEPDIWEQEERCRKAMKTVSRAIFMRLFVTAILIWSAVQNDMGLWVTGLISMVLLVNLVGALPLVKEWKKQRIILKKLIAQEPQ